MSYNGSGVFVRLYNFVNDAASSIKIRADRMDNELAGIATGLTTCITKDGQTTVTANLPMATFRHTGVGDAVNRTDYASAGQVQDGKLNWVAAGGTADAITASYTIPITALVDGQLCFVRAGAANATTTPTFAPSGLTAHTITKLGGNALVAGDIYGAGHELILRYKLASTIWELLNPAVSDAAIKITDVTTNNATASAHGFLKKLSNSAQDFMDGAGNWTTAISKVLTGYTSGAGTVASTDTILQGIQKLNGNTVAGIVPNNAVSVSSNAGTCPVTSSLDTFTNSSAATMAITIATASATDGQKKIVRIYDFSAVAQTIGWTNTENSTISVPTTSNASTTLPLTVGFLYNGSTSKWRCVAVA